MFAHKYSRTKDVHPQGTALVGEYGGRAELTAHFERQTTLGCIGCTGGLTVSGNGSTPDGETVEFADERTRTRLHLGASSFGSNGRFSARHVRVEALDATILSQRESWGWKFATIEDAGEPCLVAGTSGVEWTEADGSNGNAIGGFATGKR